VRQPYVGLVGPGEATETERRLAEAIGGLLAERRAVLVTGGLGGVMAAASRGAKRAGGLTVGILPGEERDAANEWLTIALPTGLGELRNALIVRAADVIIAVGGAYGTLSELALALKAGVPVIGLGTWAIDGIEVATTAENAVDRALRLVGRGGAG
jgi:uncharacterized protein (TIGR00725 family)